MKLNEFGGKRVGHDLYGGGDPYDAWGRVNQGAYQDRGTHHPAYRHTLDEYQTLLNNPRAHQPGSPWGFAPNNAGHNFIAPDTQSINLSYQGKRQDMNMGRLADSAVRKNPSFDRWGVTHSDAIGGPVMRFYDSDGKGVNDLAYESKSGAFLWGGAGQSNMHVISNSAHFHSTQNPDNGFWNHNPSFRNTGDNLSSIMFGNGSATRYSKSNPFSPGGHSTNVYAATTDELFKKANSMTFQTGFRANGYTGIIDQDVINSARNQINQVSGQAWGFTGAGKAENLTKILGSQGFLPDVSAKDTKRWNRDTAGMFMTPQFGAYDPFQRIKNPVATAGQQQQSSTVHSALMVQGYGLFPEGGVYVNQNDVMMRQETVPLPGYDPAYPIPTGVAYGNDPSMVPKGMKYGGGYDNGTVPGMSYFQVGKNDLTMIDRVYEKDGGWFADVSMGSRASYGEIKQTAGMKGQPHGVDVNSNPLFAAARETFDGYQPSFIMTTPSKQGRMDDVYYNMMLQSQDKSTVANYFHRAISEQVQALEDVGGRPALLDQIDQQVYLQNAEGKRVGSIWDAGYVEYDSIGVGKGADSIIRATSKHFYNHQKMQNNLRTMSVRGQTVGIDEYNSMMESGVGQQLGFSNVRPNSNGAGDVISYTLDAELPALRFNAAGPVQYKTASTNREIGMDYLASLQAAHPKIAHIIDKNIEGGALKPSRGYAEKNQLLNLNMPVLDPNHQAFNDSLPVQDFDSNAFSALYNRASKLTGGDESATIMAMRSMSSEYFGDEYQNLGGAIGPSIGSMLSAIDFKKDGSVIPSNEYKMLRGLIDYSLGSGGDKIGMGISAYAQGIDSMLNDFANGDIDRGYKYTAPAGAVQMDQRLPAGMVVWNDQTMKKALKSLEGGRTQEEIDAMYQQAQSGNLMGLNPMQYADRNSQAGVNTVVSDKWLRAKGLHDIGAFDREKQGDMGDLEHFNSLLDNMDLEAAEFRVAGKDKRADKLDAMREGLYSQYSDAIKKYGLGFFETVSDAYVAPAQALSSPTDIRGFDKDADGDLQGAMVLLPGATPGDFTNSYPGGRRFTSASGTGREIESLQKYATIDERFAGILNPMKGGITAEKMMASRDASLLATERMGTGYDPFVQEWGQWAQRGIKESFGDFYADDLANWRVRAGRVGGRIYQSFMDMDETLSPHSQLAIPETGQMSVSFSLDATHTSGELSGLRLAARGFKTPVDKKGTNTLNPQHTANYLFSSLLTGMMRNEGSDEDNREIYLGEGLPSIDGRQPEGIISAHAAALTRFGDAGDEDTQSRIEGFLRGLIDNDIHKTVGMTTRANDQIEMKAQALPVNILSDAIGAITGREGLKGDDLNEAINTYMYGSPGRDNFGNMEDMSLGSASLVGRLLNNGLKIGGDTGKRMNAKNAVDYLGKSASHLMSLAHAQSGMMSAVHEAKRMPGTQFDPSVSAYAGAVSKLSAGYGNTHYIPDGNTRFMNDIRRDHMSALVNAAGFQRELADGISMAAEGGDLGEGITLVGEKGRELVVNGKVIDNEKTEKILGGLPDQMLRGLKKKAEGDDDSFMDAMPPPPGFTTNEHGVKQYDYTKENADKWAKWDGGSDGTGSRTKDLVQRDPQVVFDVHNMGSRDISQLNRAFTSMAQMVDENPAELTPAGVKQWWDAYGTISSFENDVRLGIEAGFDFEQMFGGDAKKAEERYNQLITKSSVFHEAPSQAMHQRVFEAAGAQKQQVVRHNIHDPRNAGKATSAGEDIRNSLHRPGRMGIPGLSNALGGDFDPASPSSLLALGDAERLLKAYDTMTVKQQMDSGLVPEDVAGLTATVEGLKSSGIKGINQSEYDKQIGSLASAGDGSAGVGLAGVLSGAMSASPAQELKSFSDQIKRLGEDLPNTTKELKNVVGTFDTVSKILEGYNQEVATLKAQESEGVISDAGRANLRTLEGFSEQMQAAEGLLESNTGKVGQARARIALDKFSELDDEQKTH